MELYHTSSFLPSFAGGRMGGERVEIRVCVCVILSSLRTTASRVYLWQVYLVQFSSYICMQHI